MGTHIGPAVSIWLEHLHGITAASGPACLGDSGAGRRRGLFSRRDRRVSIIDSELDEVFARLSREPFFCGYRLARLREEKGQTPEQQADELKIALSHLVFLALSRMPQDRADLEAIAWQLEMEPGHLADVLGSSVIK
jgi:hypothetical protein